jgi:hypothetical protein
MALIEIDGLPKLKAWWIFPWRTGTNNQMVKSMNPELCICFNPLLGDFAIQIFWTGGTGPAVFHMNIGCNEFSWFTATLKIMIHDFLVRGS